jgi:hypothetical protein
VRILGLFLTSILAAGTLLAAAPAACRADAPDTALTSSAAPDASDAPRPGTDEEERAYERREAESPAAQEFKGGFVFELLILVLLVVIVILLVQ